MRNQDITTRITEMSYNQVFALVSGWRAQRAELAAELAKPKIRQRKASPDKVLTMLEGLSEAERAAVIEQMEKENAS